MPSVLKGNMMSAPSIEKRLARLNWAVVLTLMLRL